MRWGFYLVEVLPLYLFICLFCMRPNPGLGFLSEHLAVGLWIPGSPCTVSLAFLEARGTGGCFHYGWRCRCEPGSPLRASGKARENRELSPSPAWRLWLWTGGQITFSWSQSLVLGCPLARILSQLWAPHVPRRAFSRHPWAELRVPGGLQVHSRHSRGKGLEESSV